MTMLLLYLLTVAHSRRPELPVEYGTYSVRRVRERKVEGGMKY